MKKILFLIIFTPIALYAQMGIGTNTPRGALEIHSNKHGVVLPRVPSVEDLKNAFNENDPPAEGTIAYDLSRDALGIRIKGGWRLIGPGDYVGIMWDPQAHTYIKASNTESRDYFQSVSLSKDGNTLAVGAWGEDSGSYGINGDQADNSVQDAGAVYVFVRTGNTWKQQAYIKASNPDMNDHFGRSVSLSAGGDTLAVGAPGEASLKATSPEDNSAPSAGAVYLFVRSGEAWSEQALIKASYADARDYFGWSVSLSADGKTLAVGAQYEASNATGINGNEMDNSSPGAGAVYVFTPGGVAWTQQAYIKASNANEEDRFGTSVSLSADGNTLAVGATDERSGAQGVNGDQLDNSRRGAGAVYVFTRMGSDWQQQAYLKPFIDYVIVGGTLPHFGTSVSLSQDGNTLAVGGLIRYAFVFVRNAGVWEGDSVFESGSIFNHYVSLSDDGKTAAISGNSFSKILRRNETGSWVSVRNLNSSSRVSSWADILEGPVVLSGDGKTAVLANPIDQSGATGINGDQTDESAPNSGAVRVYPLYW